MKDRSGFRIEVKPKSALGKRLTNLSVYLRNRSDATDAVKAKRWCVDAGDYVEGVWTVRKSGVISFKGTSAKHGMIEFVYGKLTIGINLNKPGDQIAVPYKLSVQLFLGWINQMFPHLSMYPLTFNTRLTIY